jgi:hypothetical protein
MPTIYRLQHDDFEPWSGRQSDFHQIGVSRSLGNMLIKGRIGSAQGWYLEGRRPVNIGKGSPGHSHHQADHTVRAFRHVDGRTFCGTRIDFRKFSGVGPAATTGLIDGSRTISKGWHLDGVTPKKNGRAGAYTR